MLRSGPELACIGSIRSALYFKFFQFSRMRSTGLGNRKLFLFDMKRPALYFNSRLVNIRIHLTKLTERKIQIPSYHTPLPRAAGALAELPTPPVYD